MQDHPTRSNHLLTASTVAACVAVFATMSSGCAKGRADARVVVRDSAGVTIVEGREGVWAPGEGWTLSPEPVAMIGTEDGPDEYSLYGVRAALLLPDRRILVANRGSNELRYYDSTGTYLYAVGREGDGPGEFRFFYGVGFARDSLVVFDWGQDRISIFSASGEFGRTVMLARAPGGHPMAWGVFADGSMLGLQFLYSDKTAFGRERREVVLRRYSQEGDVLDSLGVFFTGEAYSESTPGPEPGTTFGISADAPFGRRASMVAAGQHLYYGSSETYEIRVFDLRGRLQRIIRRSVPDAPVTAKDIAEFREYFLEGSKPTSWERRRVNDLEYPETKPAYGTVTVDALGDVWVAEPSVSRRDRAGRWTVFDPEGRMLGVVDVPPDGLLNDIGDDYLIGTWRTDLGVEQVRVYRLVKK